jgi:hypothetical protein
MKPGGLGHKDKRREGEEEEDGGQGRSLGFGFMVLQASEGLGLGPKTRLLAKPPPLSTTLANPGNCVLTV